MGDVIKIQCTMVNAIQEIRKYIYEIRTEGYVKKHSEKRKQPSKFKI